MLRALIVDDEEVVTAFVEELLVDEGFLVESAATGAEALLRLGERPFDLVLVDKNLPDMSGLELLREALERRPEARVVVVTAYGSVESALEAMRGGAEDYVLKPIDDVQSFLARLRTALGRPRRDRRALAAIDARDLPAGTREALDRLRLIGV